MTGIEKEYRRAILHALEESRDFLSRSNLDSIRRHTMALLEDQNMEWNDVIFLRTMKSIVHDGDIDLCSNILAELSPSYKRKRANSLSQRMSIEVETQSPLLEINEPIDASMIDRNNTPKGQTRKEAPHRPTEHDKWKIVPKKFSDKAEFD
jgi:hypothetical protein